MQPTASEKPIGSVFVSRRRTKRVYHGNFGHLRTPRYFDVGRFVRKELVGKPEPIRSLISIKVIRRRKGNALSSEIQDLVSQKFFYVFKSHRIVHDQRFFHYVVKIYQGFQYQALAHHLSVFPEKGIQ